MRDRNRRSTNRNRYRSHSRITRVWAAFLAVFCVLSTFSVWTQASSEEDTQAQAYNGSVSVDTAYGKLTVTAAADAGILPAGAQLNVKPITEDASTKSDYDKIQKKTEELASSDQKDLSGFLAYDISFTSDGQEVEPNGKVNVSMNWENAAAPAGMETGSDVSVLHFEKDGKDNISDAKVVDLTKNQEEKKQDNTAEVTTTGDSNAVKTANLSVDSFSVFTITWTKTADTDTRIGQVNLHYVDENGLEINRTADLDTNELKKYDGQIVDISKWVENDGNTNTRKVSGYVFDHAALENIAGTKITGLKVAHDSENADQYKLFYTSSSDSDLNASTVTWNPYTDSVSKDGANNADIYLVFRSTSQRVQVHFVDEDGNLLMNPVYKYADQFVSDDGFDITSKSNSWVEDIQGYEYTGRAQCGEEGKGWQGFAFSTVRAYTTGTDTGTTNTIYRFEYKLKSTDKSWVHMTGTDVYLIYRKTTGEKLLKIHYIDSNGNNITDEAGNELTKTIDAGDWTDDDNTWHTLYGLGDSVDGYSKSTSADQDGLVVAKSGETLSFGPKVITTQSGNWEIDSSKSYGKITGNHFRYIRYVTRNGKREIQLGGGQGLPSDTGLNTATVNSSNVNRAWAVTGNFDIYLVYNKNTTADKYTYTVHYIDEAGNVIDTATQQTEITASGTDNTVTVNVSSLAKTISGYTAVSTGNTGLLGRATEESGGIPMTSLTFKSRDGGGWNYTITSIDDGKSTTSEERQLVIHNLNIYVIYQPTSNLLRVHFVDENGKAIDNSIVSKKYTALNYISSGQYYTLGMSGTYGMGYSLPDSGYTFNEIRVGSFENPIHTHPVNQNYRASNNNLNPGGEFSINYTVNGNTISSSYKDGPNGTETTTDRPIQDIYFVFSKNYSDIKVHYVYLTGDDTKTSEKRSIAAVPGATNQTITAANLPSTPSTALNLDGKTNNTYAPATIGSNYTYVETRMGPAWSNTLMYGDLGPYVQSVYKEGNQLTYYDSTTTSLSYLRNNTWYHAEDNGRRFELVRSGTEGQYNYTLSDSRHGSVSLNQENTNTYTATYHGEQQSTEYKIDIIPSESGNTTTYNLTVTDWTPENQTDIYEIYIDSSAEQLWIQDDQIYSGYLIANKTSTIPSGGTYAWYKTVTNSDSETTTSQVLRRQTGEHYNVEYNPTRRTWLDVEADEGGLNSTSQTAVSYYVTYTYTSGGRQYTVTSNPVKIPYYSELKNGSFESPDYGPKGDIGETGKPINQVTNDEYLNTNHKNGVWQSTGTGTESGGRSNVNIEIVNTVADNHSFKGSYRWYGDAPYAKDGDQFAELNCSAAGALYQDVVTHPNEQLHYWFSHRARGQNPNSTPEYDTMYLVIMPTKLAMTSAKDGGELKTQSDLIDFISAHGGFSYNLATSVGQEVTHAEDDDGIFILKVSSNDQFWHTVRSINGYTAKGGLTRFFFTAGPTSWNGENGSRSAVEKATHGNFIDDVGFSQTFPKTDGFNLSVTKTFTGVSDDDLAKLASNASEAKVPDAESNSFQISISNQYLRNNGLTDTGALVALNGAKLGFRVDGTSGNYTFTPTASSKDGENILTGSNSGVVIRGDGSITMTWTFLDQSMRNSEGDEATGSENSFYYTVREEHAGLNNQYLTATETHSNTTSAGRRTSGSGESQYIHQGDSAVFNITNSYSSTRPSDQPRLVITKTFTGLTQSAVDALLPNYTLRVQRNGNEPNFITLCGNTENPVVSTEGVNYASSEVSVTVEHTVNKDGSTTLTWEINGWGREQGPYTITEEGYDTSMNPLSSVSVNGTTNNITDTQRTVASTDQNKPVEIKGKQKSGIEVGTESTASKIQYDETKTKKIDIPSNGNIGTDNQPAENSNLLIAQYTLSNTSGTSTSSSEKHYLVWTPQKLSANTAEGILEKINSDPDWKLSQNDKATLENTQFHGNANPGSTSVGLNGEGTVTYDTTHHTLSFNNSGAVTWNKYISTRYWIGDANSTDSGKYTDTDIAIKNSYSPEIKLLKVDSNNSSTVLAGAEFKLYRRVNSEKEYLISRNASTGAINWGKETAETKALTLQTDDSGMADIGILPAATNQDPGYDTYYLEEVKAPAGYNKLIKPLSIRVTKDGNVEVGTTDTLIDGSVDNSKLSVSNQQAYYLVTIQNKAGIRLPNTGGKGIWSFIAIGIALIIMAALLYWRNKVDEKEDEQLIRSEYLKKK